MIARSGFRLGRCEVPLADFLKLECGILISSLSPRIFFAVWKAGLDFGLAAARYPSQIFFTSAATSWSRLCCCADFLQHDSLVLILAGQLRSSPANIKLEISLKKNYYTLDSFINFFKASSLPTRCPQHRRSSMTLETMSGTQIPSPPKRQVKLSYYKYSEIGIQWKTENKIAHYWTILFIFSVFCFWVSLNAEPCKYCQVWGLRTSC